VPKTPPMGQRPHSRRLGRAIFAAVLSLACLPALALERGVFESGIYTAPGQLFSVRSPLGPEPYVIDSFDDAAGAVTFVDEAGGLYGIVCTPNFDVLAGADNDRETDLAILRNWFREATFPLFFGRQIPGAEIVHDGPGTFEGRPAWIGLMRLPHGSAMLQDDPETGVPTRQDSWRGIAVFMRGGHTFMIMTETPPQTDWNSFLPRLSEFYSGMAFSAPLAAAESQLAGLH
jgi:hypothetical protein